MRRMFSFLVLCLATMGLSSSPTYAQNASQAPTSRPASPKKAVTHSIRLRGKFRTRPSFYVLGRLPARPLSAAKQQSSLVHSINQFAVAFYQKQAKQNQKNLIFSPYSIFDALSLVYAGARKKTAQQMSQALHISLSLKQFHESFSALMRKLQFPSPPPQAPRKRFKRGAIPTLRIYRPPFQLTVANRLWTQQGFAFLPEYLGVLAKYYRTLVSPVDFRRNSEKARQTINQWVAQQTHQKIKQLLSPGSVKANTKLLIANAVYFKSAWSDEFTKQHTKKADFWLNSKRKKKADMMHQINWYQYASLPSFQLLEIPYESLALSLVVLVPKRKNGLAALETQLSANNIFFWLKKKRRTYLSLFFPKFKCTSQFRLRSALRALGIKDGFLNKADFSGMTKQKIKISGGIHQAFIDVHEKGTEAAAATAIKFIPISLPPPTPKPILFKVDRPFVFFIRHNFTQTILFFGRVTNP